MDVKILLAVLSCLALATNGFPAQDKDHYILSGVFIPSDAIKNLNNNLEKHNNNQGINDATVKIQQNSDQTQTNSELKIIPTNQQQQFSQQQQQQQSNQQQLQNQQPIIVHQSLPLQNIGVAQPKQAQQLYVAQQTQPQPVVVGQQNQQPQPVIIGQPNQQGVYVVQPNQPNQQAVIYTPSTNQQQVPSNQQQILVSQPGQQPLVSQPNLVQVPPNGQQHGQAVLVPKPGENNVYTLIPLNNQNNYNQNQAVSNGNTIWVPVQ